jgi:hypothetical protein
MQRLNLWYRTMRMARLAVGVGAVLILAGCESLVEYTERDVLPPEALGGSAGADALYAGALRSTGRTFAGDGGGTEGQALISGLFTDEWFHSGTFSTRVDYDQRAPVLDNGTLEGVVRNLQTGRLDAVRAINAIVSTGKTSGTDARIGKMYNRIGAAFMFGGMNYCNGFVYTSIVDGATVYGAQLTVSQMLDSAVVYFNLALAGAAGTGSDNHHTANLMKARILMMRGTSSFAAAATTAASVPTSFRATNEHSTINGGTENGIFRFNVDSERWTVAHKEGINGLPFRGAGDGTNSALADPRVPWTRTANNTDIGFDTVSPQYDLLIYATRSSSSIWGKGEEARLIEAEALLQGGNTQGWLDKLNALRAGVTGLAPLTDPGTAAGRQDLHFSERAFWLFANGTRLMDIRRLITQYGRSQSAILPTGPYPKGGTYESDVNFPVPSRENQNPSLGTSNVVCIDRNA